MKDFKKYLLLCMLLVSVITGCGKEEVEIPATNTDSVNNTQDTQTSNDSENLNESNNSEQENESTKDVNELNDSELNIGELVNSSDAPVYAYNDKLPIIVNGKAIAFAKINQFERVNITDWYNEKAKKENISHSYSLNMSIINEVDQVLTIAVTPTLIDKNNTNVSSYCNVGWTGFAEKAEFYGKGKMHIEVGLQPEIKDEKGLKIKIVFNTNLGDSEPVIISSKIFKHVVKGPGLHDLGEKVVIKSVNGAKFSYKINNLYREENRVGLIIKDAVEFDTRIKYISKPVKSIQVDTFDQKKKYAMYASPVIGLQTQHDSFINYETATDASRLNWYGEFEDYYVSETDKALKVGKGVTYHLNRIVSGNGETDKFMRFRVEFPEEAKASSLKQMLAFNGRFLVYQGEVGKRVISLED